MGLSAANAMLALAPATTTSGMARKAGRNTGISCGERGRDALGS
jgi:hypothetical protein